MTKKLSDADAKHIEDLLKWAAECGIRGDFEGYEKYAEVAHRVMKRAFSEVAA